MKDQFTLLQELGRKSKPNVTNLDERKRLTPQWKKDEQTTENIKTTLGITDVQEVKIEGLRRDGICE